MRPAVGGPPGMGAARRRRGRCSGVLLLAVPQMYGVGYPVMYKAVAGGYAIVVPDRAGWSARSSPTSLTIGIGGSGGVFAPVAVHRRDLGHGLRRHRPTTCSARPPASPALYAVVGDGRACSPPPRGPR